MNDGTFLAYVEQILVLTLSPGNIVILDNKPRLGGNDGLVGGRCEQAIRSLSAPVRHRERCMLIGLERDLLCQHNIADGKAPLRPEAPDGDLHIVLAEFVDVHLTTVADAIVLPAVAARHIEVPRALVLGKLDRRQPLFQQVECFLLCLPAPGRRTGEIPPPCKGKPQYQGAQNQNGQRSKERTGHQFNPSPKSKR